MNQKLRSGTCNRNRFKEIGEKRKMRAEIMWILADHQHRWNKVHKQTQIRITITSYFVKYINTKHSNRNLCRKIEIQIDGKQTTNINTRDRIAEKPNRKKNLRSRERSKLHVDRTLMWSYVTSLLWNCGEINCNWRWRCGETSLYRSWDSQNTPESLKNNNALLKVYTSVTFVSLYF